MHILVVSQFFAPEMGAPAARFGDLGRQFVAAGHRVTVLTTFPNFPQGKVYPGHRQAVAARETVDGIDVLRTPLLALGGHSPLRKAALYASFAGSALLQGGLRALRPDIVIGTTPPPTVAYASLGLARRFGVPHVVDIRDIWPEAVVNAGRVQAGAAVRALESLNAVVLRQSAVVTTVSEGKRERLLQLGARPGTVHVLPNGADLDQFDRWASEHEQAARAFLGGLGVDERLPIALYAGVFNPPQGLDGLLDVAARRQARADSLQIVLVGDGALRDHLQQRIATEGLANVKMGGPVDRTLIPALYARSTATVVILRPRKDTHTVPSKIYEAMAAGRPVVLSADGEVQSIARAAGCGPVGDAGDLTALDDNLDRIVGDPEAAQAMGASGRAYARQYNDRAVLAQRYLDLLAGAVDRDR